MISKALRQRAQGSGAAVSARAIVTIGGLQRGEKFLKLAGNALLYGLLKCPSQICLCQPLSFGPVVLLGHDIGLLSLYASQPTLFLTPHPAIRFQISPPDRFHVSFRRQRRLAFRFRAVLRQDAVNRRESEEMSGTVAKTRRFPLPSPAARLQDTGC